MEAVNTGYYCSQSVVSAKRQSASGRSGHCHKVQPERESGRGETERETKRLMKQY